MARLPRIDAQMKREALLASPFFRPMRPAEIDEIIGFAVERRAARGTVIFSKGDPGSFLMAVLSGRLRASNVSSDGKEVTLNVIGAGEIAGEIALLDGKPRSTDLTALEDTTLMLIERRDFLPFLRRHDGLMERLLLVLCERLRSTSMALEQVSMFDLPARLAHRLAGLAAQHGRELPRAEGGGVRIELKLSQRDLSILVASSRESVNKQLRIWREDGTISLREGRIVVLKPSVLRAAYE